MADIGITVEAGNPVRLNLDLTVVQEELATDRSYTAALLNKAVPEAGKRVTDQLRADRDGILRASGMRLQRIEFPVSPVTSPNVTDSGPPARPPVANLPGATTPNAGNRTVNAVLVPAQVTDGFARQFIANSAAAVAACYVRDVFAGSSRLAEDNRSPDVENVVEPVAPVQPSVPIQAKA